MIAINPIETSSQSSMMVEISQGLFRLPDAFLHRPFPFFATNEFICEILVQ